MREQKKKGFQIHRATKGRPVIYHTGPSNGVTSTQGGFFLPPNSPFFALGGEGGGCFGGDFGPPAPPAPAPLGVADE